jgi:methylase of polypeptide subunit release factors
MNHLDFAHQCWRSILTPEDTVLDATCGNGKDTLQLIQMVPSGKVVAIDIQPCAIDRTQKLLEKCQVYDPEKVSLLLQSHVDLPPLPYKLIVYNLGYLPGTDRQLTTQASSTLASLYKGASLLLNGGALSIMAYPHDPEEVKTVKQFAGQLEPTHWEIALYPFPAAFFLFLKKRIT